MFITTTGSLSFFSLHSQTLHQNHHRQLPSSPPTTSPASNSPTKRKKNGPSKARSKLPNLSPSSRAPNQRGSLHKQGRDQHYHPTGSRLGETDCVVAWYCERLCSSQVCSKWGDGLAVLEFWGVFGIVSPSCFVFLVAVAAENSTLPLTLLRWEVVIIMTKGNWTVTGRVGKSRLLVWHMQRMGVAQPLFFVTQL